MTETDELLGIVLDLTQANLSTLKALGQVRSTRPEEADVTIAQGMSAVEAAIKKLSALNGRLTEDAGT